VIRYDVYVNGVLSDTVFGSSGRSIVYGAVGIESQFDVVARTPLSTGRLPP
jgi:hypothetical protein